MEVFLREAEVTDAKNILAYLKEVAQETHFLILEDLEVELSTYEKALAFTKESRGHLLLLAENEEAEILGMVNINGAEEKLRQHIGEVGISVKKIYWHQGLASLLLDEALYWWEEFSQLTRLELYVQSQNQAAIHLYEKFGFLREGCLKNGVQLGKNQFDDVLVMGKIQEK